ncbi:cysteine hydrolase family protein [Phenylobacterium immobile]|uniref:cysteine hydrolase family protein n=1 Tax=Phenylobacterium immobile TaxID=21 RepID=UPI001C400B0E|nr:isochorismatase family cysteine hydrolase [Phenylobacterium immobile]
MSGQSPPIDRPVLAAERPGLAGVTGPAMGQTDADNAGIKGCAPGGAGLLVVDMINALDFDGAEALRAPALKAAGVVARLRDQADALGVPVIYVNDNYGEWRAERSHIVAHCRAQGGADLVERLAPRDHDYFVIKPAVSGFYATTLQVLLPRLGVSRLVMTGLAADICVLFTAADAHMRAYDLWVPADAVASSSPQHRDWALEIMRKAMGADTRPAGDRDLRSWIDKAKEAP